VTGDRVYGSAPLDPRWYVPCPASVGGETAMLYYAVVFFVIALVAAFFGFSGVAVGAAGIAKILFFAFLAIAVISLLVGRRSI